MINVSNVKLQFGARVLFENVSIKFASGNCYGIIGANGAGKSTFLKLLSGKIEPSKGEISIGKGERMSVLEQNQNAYDAYTVREAVICGHKELSDIRRKREVLYAKTDFTEEDGNLAAELETKYGELGGYECEIDAESLLNNIGVSQSLFDVQMSEIEPKIKVKVLVAQCLFGKPDILLLDEPTNNLDIKTVRWLQEYLKSLELATVLVVSHNRHFLNQVCTHICDVDYSAINMFVGNYDFWYESSQLILRQQREANKKAEARIKELREFIARFSANASKSKQATSRKRELDKIEIQDIKPSSRKYPYIDFKFERDPGNDILRVEKLCKDGYFQNVTFSVGRDDKIGFLTDNSRSVAEYAIEQLCSIAYSARASPIRAGSFGAKTCAQRTCRKTTTSISTAARCRSSSGLTNGRKTTSRNICGRGSVGCCSRVHARAHDAAFAQFPHIRRADEPPRFGEYNVAQQGHDKLQSAHTVYHRGRGNHVVGG